MDSTGILKLKTTRALLVAFIAWLLYVIGLAQLLPGGMWPPLLAWGLTAIQGFAILYALHAYWSEYISSSSNVPAEPLDPDDQDAPTAGG